jgi:hypothetical protein
MASASEWGLDLYRPALYGSLRWPPPSNPEQEYESGRQLTAYLRRGSRAPTPTFNQQPGSLNG